MQCCAVVILARFFAGHQLWTFQTHFAGMLRNAGEWLPLRATQRTRRLGARWQSGG